MDAGATARAVLVDDTWACAPLASARVRPWNREFCNVALPRDIFDVKDRLHHNSTYFIANYVILLQIAVLIGLLSNIWALLLGSVFTGATYSLLFTDCASGSCNGVVRYAFAVPLMFLTIGFVLSFAHELIYTACIWLFVVFLHVTGRPVDAKGSYLVI